MPSTTTPGCLIVYPTNTHLGLTCLLISLLCSIILTYLLYQSAGHTRGFLLEHVSFLLSLRKRSNIFREREVGQCCHSNDITFSNQGVNEDPEKNKSQSNFSITICLKWNYTALNDVHLISMHGAHTPLTFIQNELQTKTKSEKLTEHKQTLWHLRQLAFLLIWWGLICAFLYVVHYTALCSTRYLLETIGSAAYYRR